MAFVPGTTTNPFYITMQAGAQAEANKLGIKLLWQGGTEWSASNQTPYVDALLADHPSALVIVPTDATAMQAPIQQFVSAHIPVITADTTITDTSLLNSRITCNNTSGGQQAADELASLIGDAGQVAIINNEPGVTTDDQREDGFAQEMAAKYPNVSIVATEYDDESVTTADAQTSTLMLAYPNLKGIFAIDTPSGEGVGSALQSAKAEGKVFGVAYDAAPQEATLLQQGYLSALVIQQPALEGSTAVQYAYDLVTGHKSEVQSNVVLPDVLATTSDASSPSISKYFYVSSLSGS
ncbi:MAG: ABC transporter substrate-binding protein [Candidatus Dormiibacterota bacterium]